MYVTAELQYRDQFPFVTKEDAPETIYNGRQGNHSAEIPVPFMNCASYTKNHP